MRFTWRESATGLARRSVRRVGRRRVRKVTAVVAALALVVSLGVVAVVVATSPSGPGALVQQSGTAAGRSHRVPSSSTIAAVVDGKVVPEKLAQSASARAARAAAALREVRAPEGAVAPSSQAKLKLGAAKPRDSVSVLRAPTAPGVKGYNPRTSKVVEGQTSPDRVVYQNADGSRTAQFFDGQVNFRMPDGSWASVNTSLIPATGTGTGSPSAPPPLLPTAEPSPLLSPAEPSPSAQVSPGSAAGGGP